MSYAVRWLVAALSAALILIVAAPVARAQSAAGLVAAYGFEESFGPTATDSAAGANPGTLAGAARSATGRFGSALSFDGVDDRVDVADSSSLDLTAGMTLEAWVRPETVSDWRTVLLKERPGQLTYALYASEGAGRPMAELNTASGQRDARGATALAAQQWSHLATTYDGTTLRVYVNGAEVGSQPMTGLITTTTGALRIGGNTIWGEHFQGLIDEVRVYNRALTAGEIGGDMARAVVTGGADATPPTVSLPGDCTGTKLVHDTIEIVPSASDDRGAASVRLELDGQPLYQYTGGSLSYMWQTRNATKGKHVIRAIARDGAGNETVSDACEYDVFNPTFTVAFEAPAANSTVRGTTTVRAQVLGDGEPLPRDNWLNGGNPVESIRFELPGVAAQTDTTYPYEATWDTTTVMPGVKTLRATAALSSAWPATQGLAGTTTVTVDNSPVPDTTAPTVSLPLTCNGATVRDYITLRANFADDRGPVTLTVKVDDTTIYTTSAPTSGSPLFQWETRPFSNGTHVMTAIARDAAGNEAVTPPCEWNVHNPAYTISFASPADGDVVSGTVNVRAQPLADGQPRTSGFVVFSGTAVPLTTDSASPYELTWDTNKLANGVYMLKAEALTVGYIAPDATSTIQVRVENVVTKPAGLSATLEGDDAKLAWTAAPSGSNVAGYRVLRDGAQIATLAGTAATYTDADRPAGTYRYRLVAVNAGGVASDPSDEASVTVTPPATAPGLVAAYGFETASGTVAADSSASGANAGTISGATSVTGGKFGRALSFDGVNDMVTVADSSPLDLAPGMTLSAWVKPSTVVDWRTVLLKERPGQLAYALYAATDNGRPMTEIAASGQREARGPAALTAGAWTHVAATYDKAALKLYVNGAQVASTPATATLFNSAGVLRIGGNNIWGEWFSGLIDEVRIYERALTAAEIQTDSTRAVAP